MMVVIKGISYEIIEENGIKYYKDYFCECPDHEKIPIKKNHKKIGIPKFIMSHWQKTPEAKKITSIRMSGKNHPFYGTHRSDFQKQEQSKIMKGKNCRENHYLYEKHLPEKTKLILSEYAKLRVGSKNPFFGKNHTQESIKLIKQNMPDFSGSNNPMYGRPAPHPKKYFEHFTPFQGTLKMYKWEYLLAKYYDLNNILYVYEPKAFELKLNNEKQTTYTPDFYLPDIDEYIEVKGYWRGDAKEKFEKFLETYPEINIKILYEKDLQDLKIDLT